MPAYIPPAMPIASATPEIRTRVEELLKAAENKGVFLKVTRDHFDETDHGWYTIEVDSFRPDGSVTEEASTMTKVERALRKEGYDQVMLVPKHPLYD